MPPPRKIDLLPPELRQRLNELLRARNFSGYEQIAEDLAFWCEEQGIEIRIGKSAIHAYGQDFRDYVRMQEQAQDEIKAFLEQASMGDEARVTQGLFQQLTAIQWQLQKTMMVQGDLPDPKGMKELTTALNNLIRSTSLRDAIIKADRAEQASKLDAAEARGDLTADIAQRAREIMGFA